MPAPPVSTIRSDASTDHDPRAIPVLTRPVPRRGHASRCPRVRVLLRPPAQEHCSSPVPLCGAGARRRNVDRSSDPVHRIADRSSCPPPPARRSAPDELAFDGCARRSEVIRRTHGGLEMAVGDEVLHAMGRRAEHPGRLGDADPPISRDRTDVAALRPSPVPRPSPSGRARHRGPPSVGRPPPLGSRRRAVIVRSLPPVQLQPRRGRTGLPSPPCTSPSAGSLTHRLPLRCPASDRSRGVGHQTERPRSGSVTFLRSSRRERVDVSTRTRTPTGRSPCAKRPSPCCSS
jgi:hypothetical protein